MLREEAHKNCLSRDCSCVNGKDRDTNYHQTIDKIYDEHEAQIKAKDDEIKDLHTAMIKLNEHYHIAKNDLKVELKAKDEEVERLKAIVEDAIRKPMGVEPHSWSDYKMNDK